MQPVLADQIADMWSDIQGTLQLLLRAARLVDAGATDANFALFASKADVAATATRMTQVALEFGCADNSKITRLIRDTKGTQGLRRSHAK